MKHNKLSRTMVPILTIAILLGAFVLANLASMAEAALPSSTSTSGSITSTKTSTVSGFKSPNTGTIYTKAGCYWANVYYSDGAIITVGGVSKRCDDGSWK